MIPLRADRSGTYPRIDPLPRIERRRVVRRMLVGLAVVAAVGALCGVSFVALVWWLWP